MADHKPPASAPSSVSIDCYSEGESRRIEVAGIEITIRFVGRKGRKGRIAITAPAGTVFRDVASG